MTKYITYYRVSTKDQNLGIDAQKSMVHNFLTQDDSVIGTYEEKETGTRKKIRPALLKAIEECKDTGATLLIAKLDRLSRNVNFITTLQERGVKFKACDMPEADEFVVHIMAALAEKEARDISTRTKAALNELKKKGVKLGGPYKLSDEDRMKGVQARKIKRNTNPNLKRSRAFAKLLRKQGDSYDAIARELNTNGFKTSRGKLYSATQVMRLLK